MQNLQSDTLGEIGTALVKAQASLGRALKDTTGQIGQNRNYKYADLASVQDAAAPALEANGLCVVQRPMPSDTGVCVSTMLLHTSGEWISDGGLHLPMQKIDPQGAGSSLTYARRYGLAAMLGVVQDDDDAASATVAQQRPVAVVAAPVAVVVDKGVQAVQAAFGATTIDDYTFKFGKHKGVTLQDVEGSYLDWLLKQPAKEGYEDESERQHSMFRRELARRDSVTS